MHRSRRHAARHATRRPAPRARGAPGAPRAARRAWWPLAVVLLLAAGCAAPAPRVVVARAGTGVAAVACVERHAARAGAEVLARGGNAADATVAAALVLAVTWPPAGNLGGGGVALVRTPDGAAHALDFREEAPAAVTRDFFLDAQGAPDRAVSEHPALPVGVPGTPAGLAALHARHGSLPWAELVEPARRLADEGFEVDALLERFTAAAAPKLARSRPAADTFLDASGAARPAGARVVQPRLALTLRRLAWGGGESFYAGVLAEELVADLADAGGVMTLDDLAAYEAVWRDPLRVPVVAPDRRRHELLAMPPPSAGGLTVAQSLFMLADRGGATLDTTAGRHVFVESARRAFAERARWLGDPDVVHVPVAGLLDPAHLLALGADIDPHAATPSAALAPPPARPAPEPQHTTQLTVVDAQGLLVSCTLTLEANFGSGLLGARTGVLFNNQLNDFDRDPDPTHTSDAALVAPNAPGPGKRPVTSMSPVILLRDGEPLLATGSPGGRTIPNTVSALVWRALTQPELSPEELVAAPRLHHQWQPDALVLEANRFHDDEIAALEALGHTVLVRPVQPPLLGTQGAAHTLVRWTPPVAVGDERAPPRAGAHPRPADAPPPWYAVGDPRREGWVGLVVLSPDAP